MWHSCVIWHTMDSPFQPMEYICIIDSETPRRSRLLRPIRWRSSSDKRSGFGTKGFGAGGGCASGSMLLSVRTRLATGCDVVSVAGIAGSNSHKCKMMHLGESDVCRLRMGCDWDLRLATMSTNRADELSCTERVKSRILTSAWGYFIRSRKQHTGQNHLSFNMAGSSMNMQAL